MNYTGQDVNVNRNFSVVNTVEAPATATATNDNQDNDNINNDAMNGGGKRRRRKRNTKSESLNFMLANFLRYLYSLVELLCQQRKFYATRKDQFSNGDLSK